MASRPLRTNARAFEEESIPATIEDKRHQGDPVHAKQKDK